VAELIALVGVPLLLAGAAAWAMMREDARLRSRARRYRQLELEGIEQLRRTDPYPEHAPVPGGFLREPDGRTADTDRVLHDELERVREHTRRAGGKRSRTRSLRRGKGASCLV
jgi:hypothetical protein